MANLINIGSALYGGSLSLVCLRESDQREWHPIFARQTTQEVVWFPRRSMFFTKYILVFCPPGQPAAVQILFQTNLLRTAFNAISLSRLCSFCHPRQNVLKTCHSSARSRGKSTVNAGGLYEIKSNFSNAPCWDSCLSPTFTGIVPKIDIGFNILQKKEDQAGHSQ